MRFLISFDIECAPNLPNGIALILAGRIKGHMKTRFVPTPSVIEFWI